MSQVSSQLKTTSINRQIFRALLSLASATLLIRVMGMLNQLVVTAHFGAGAVMDAYLVAYALPYLLAQLIINAIEYSVIPVYAGVRSQGNKEQAAILFSTLLNLLLISSVVLTVVMFIFRRQMVFFSAPALDPFRSGFAIDLTPFILPAFLLMIVVGFLEYILNTEGQFGWPAYAGLLVPLTTAGLVLIGSKSYGVLMLCIGMAVGLCLQICVLIMRAKHAKLVYRPVLNLRSAEIGLILTAAVPALLGSLVGQASPVVDQIFASSLSAGSISALSYSLKFVSVFTAVIFGSAGQALFPHLSRQAAANDMNGFKETLRLYLWGIAISTILLTVFTLVLAHPLVQILFQRGAFTAENTTQTADALRGFVIGLTPMGFGFILSRAFGAIRKNSITMYVAIFSVFANAIFDYIFARFWQSTGIALATSAVYFCTVFILLFTLRRRVGKLYLFVPPQEIVMVIQQGKRWLGMRRFYLWWWILRQNLFPPDIFYRIRQQLIRIAIIISIFAIGIFGVFVNALYTLRIALGSSVVLLLLRYRYVLLFAWVLYPVVVRANPHLSGSNILTGLIAPTVLLMTAMPIKQTFKRLPALTLLLICVLWMFPGIFISPIGFSAALTNWVIYLTYAALGVLAINVLTTRRRILLVINAMLLSGTYVALYGIYGYITRQNGDAGPQVGFRIFSIFASSPSLALFLSLVIPLGFYCALTTRGFKRFVYSLSIPILLIALVLTFTRGAFLSLPLSIGVIVLLVPSRKMRIGLLSGISGLAALVLLAAMIGNVPILSRFFGEDITTLNGRTYLWQTILSNFDPTQLFGRGLQASDAFLANSGVASIATAPHSLFLGALYDQGIIGAVILIFIFIVLLANLIMGMRRASGERRILFVVAIAVFINVFLLSIDNSDLWIEDFSIYFWIIMALPFALYWDTPNPASAANREVLDIYEANRLPEQIGQSAEQEQVTI